MENYKNLDINDLDGEIWKVIEEFPDYSVSNFGRVKSFKKWHGTNERILKQGKNTDGYLIVDLSKSKKSKTKLVNRLVYETFKEKLGEGYDAHHISENKEDNFVENLKSIPESEHSNFHNPKGECHRNFGKHHSEETKKKMNENHADFRGENNPNFGKFGEESGNHKLTNQKISEIKIDIEKGDLTQMEMVIKYNISQSSISRIKNGKRKIKCGD
jgi:hypothetical protein